MEVHAKHIVKRKSVPGREEFENCQKKRSLEDSFLRSQPWNQGTSRDGNQRLHFEHRQRERDWLEQHAVIRAI